MSDFLDRVAARVIGGDAAMLTPRIPSMYEPTQPVANAPLEMSMSVPAAPVSPHDDDVVASVRPKSLDATTKQARSEAPSDAVNSEHTQVAPTKPDRIGQAPVVRTKETAPSFSAQHVAIEQPARRLALEPHSKTSSHEGVGRSPETARAAAAPVHAFGVLLPPEQPVFGASLAHAMKRATPERGHGAVSQAQGESHEPVVHVSIGRIDVRASSPASAPPRRQDAARVDRLGDYLRERNKASP